MSVVSYSETPKKSRPNELLVDEKKSAKQKVLEEDEYLGHMAKIIRRDFFSDIEFPSGLDTPSSSQCLTPATSRTDLSSTSSIRSRPDTSNMSLNEYLDRYTSEDNAYFEKLQRKELKRHRVKYPWLYEDKTGHNKRVQEQLKLPSIREQASLGSSCASTKMIDWPHNPRNSFFHAPDNSEASKRPQSVINYHSNKYINESLFKMPLQPTSKATARPRTFTGFSDKIGIDGKLVNVTETPIINGYSFIPPPETPAPVVEKPTIKVESNRFYIPIDSPRDELAQRLYQEKVAKVIRTPKIGSGSTPMLKTPSLRKGYANFTFSPERVKTSNQRRNK